MKILVFTAAQTVAQTLAVAQVLKALRQEGHTAGERSIQHFRLEKEPADALILMANEGQIKALQPQLLEIRDVFVNESNKDDEDFATFVTLPADDELGDFDPASVSDKFKNDDKSEAISFEQAKAEAIERGLEVNAATTRDELQRMLGLDISPATQAFERSADEVNNLRKLSDERVGLRTSSILPTVNGVDFVRMNDEQLAAAAAGAGLSVSKNMKRETIINKLVQLNAQQAGLQQPPVTADDDAGTVEEGDNADLNGKTNDELRAIAENETIDVGTATKKSDLQKAIVDGRAAKATSNG